MKFTVAPGETSVRRIRIRILKDDGKANTSLVYNSAGLSASYQIDDGAPVPITLATLSSSSAAYSPGGFVHVGNGWYRIDPPAGAIPAAGAGSDVLIIFAEATDIRPGECQIEADVRASTRQADLPAMGAYWGQAYSEAAGTAGTASGITLASAPAQSLLGWWILTTGGTGLRQIRQITAHTAGTTAASVAPNWTVTPQAGTNYTLIPRGAMDLGTWRGAQPSAIAAGRVAADAKAIAGVSTTASAGAISLDSITFTTTVGTSTLTAAGVWDYLTSAAVTVGTFGKLLKDYLGGGSKVAATIATNDMADIQAARAAKIDNADATISSRASQTSLNSVAAALAALANQTDTSLAVPTTIIVPAAGTLAHRITAWFVDSDNANTAIDMDSVVLTVVNAAGTDRSSRLSASTRSALGKYFWTYTSTAGDAQEQLTFAVVGTVTGNGTWQNVAASEVVDNAINAYTPTDRARDNNTATLVAAVPTALQNAAATRTNFATELARIDVSIGSRMGTFTYVVPPTAVQNGTAVRTELATELAHLDANVSSATAPTVDAIRDAVWTRTVRAITDKDGFGLSTPARATLVQEIADASIQLATLVQAVREDIERTGGKLDQVNLSNGSASPLLTELRQSVDALALLLESR